jgi:signal peptidase I
LAPLSVDGGESPRHQAAAIRWHDLVALLAGLLLAAAFLKLFVIGAVRVPSPSMEGTLRPGDYLLVSKIGYGATVPLLLPWSPSIFIAARVPALRTPRLGDVVVFQYGTEPSAVRTHPPRLLVKRCVAVAGDTLLLLGGRIFVNGRELLFPGSAMPHGAPSGTPRPPAFGPVVIPEGHCFVLGDNPEQSADSRMFGPVPTDAIVGRAVLIYWSMSGDASGGPGVRQRIIHWDRIGTLIR